MDASTGHVDPQTSDAICATVAGKGTCGCYAGEMEDVYNGPFCFVCDKKYMKTYFKDEKSMFFKSKYYEHIL